MNIDDICLESIKISDVTRSATRVEILIKTFDEDVNATEASTETFYE